MQKKIVSLDVGAGSIKGLEVLNRSGVPTVVKADILSLENAVVSNGTIESTELLTSGLTRLWKKAKFSTRDVYLIANGSDRFNKIKDRIRDFGGTREMLPTYVNDLPFNLQEFYISYHLLDEYNEEGINYKNLLVAGVPTVYADALISSVEKAKLKPFRMDVLPYALINSFPLEEETADKIIASVELGASETNIVIHQRQQPLYLHSSRMGSGRTTEKIATTLSITYVEADFLKRLISEKDAEIRDNMEENIILPDGRAATLKRSYFQDASIGAAQSIIAQEVSNLISHIGDSINEASVETDSSASEIVLSGGGAKLALLESRLAGETQIPTRLARPFDAIATNKLPAGVVNNQHLFAVAVGAVVGGVADV